mmetsp:Transcript_29957/g.58555  ORF Transcript_29957/g.58555 Transcript_29957/m.58555 type:complete len:87 (-) Transcript_29957:11-271(-)
MKTRKNEKNKEKKGGETKNVGRVHSKMSGETEGHREKRGKQENIINACTYDYYPASDAPCAYYATYAARKTTAVHALPRLLCTFLS